MQFAFQRVPITLPPSGSPTTTPARLRPILPLRIHGPQSQTASLLMLVDSGADEICLPVHLIPTLGLNPSLAQTRTLTGVGVRTAVYYFPVELEIQTGPTDRIRWRTTVSFGQVPQHLGLFGIAGGLEFFHFTMNVVDSWFSLAPHPLLPAVPPIVYPHTPYPIP